MLVFTRSSRGKWVFLGVDFVKLCRSEDATTRISTPMHRPSHSDASTAKIYDQSENVAVASAWKQRLTQSFLSNNLETIMFQRATGKGFLSKIVQTVTQHDAYLEDIKHLRCPVSDNEETDMRSRMNRISNRIDRIQSKSPDYFEISDCVVKN
jgi:hypothetical protein